MTPRRASPLDLLNSPVRRAMVLFGLFCSLALLVYWPALGGPLIYDDFHHVTRPELRSWTGLTRIWIEPWATAQYYPVTHSFFWLQHRIWGDTLVLYHLVNVVLHAGAALLLTIVVRKLGFGRFSYLAGVVFLLHPVAVESVAWISEQKNTLSCVFFLSSAAVYLGFHENRRWRSYALATALFALALLSKSVTATLPASLLIIFWWKTGRLEWRRDFLPLLPWFIAGIASGLYTAWLEKHSIGAEGPSFALSAIERGLLAGRAFWFYLGKAVFPVDLVFNYARWSIDPNQLWQYAYPFGALFLAGAAVWMARNNRGPLAWLLLFGIQLFPVLGFFNIYPFRFSYVADHFMYLALLPFAVGAAGSLTLLVQNHSEIYKKWVLVGSTIVLICLAITAHRHSRIFDNEEGFYRAILLRNPNSALAHYNLGTLLARRSSDRELAITEYRRAIAIDPQYAEAYNNLGMLLLTQPATRAEAEAAFVTAVTKMPDLVEANFNLAMMSIADDTRRSQTIRLMEKVIKLRPNFAEAHYQLGHLLEREAKNEEAKSAYLHAIQLRPDYFDAHYALGLLSADNPAQLVEAEQQLAEAVRLKADFADAHYSLGAVRARLPNKQDDAIASYREALRLEPDFAEAHNNLGRLLVQKPGGMAEALFHFEQALRINPNSNEARRNYEIARKQISKQN